MLSYRYELSDSGDLPITLKQAKDYLKIDGKDDNQVIQDLLATAVQFGEGYTGRDFRISTWLLFVDCFEDRILLRKAQVASITKVEYLVSAAFITVASSVYYLKPGHGFSEILLADGEIWPTDIDTIEAGIKIEFKTQVPRSIEQLKTGVYKHLAFLYQNRGDCDEDAAAKKSGATEQYDQVRIARI